MIDITISVPYLTRDVVKKLNETIVVLDTETTGFSPYNDRVVEFGAIKLVGGKPVDSMSILINPEMSIPYSATKVHGITDDMVRNKPTERECVKDIEKFLEGATYIVGHNVSFDIRFLTAMFERSGKVFSVEYIDTLKFSRTFIPNSPNHQLGTLAAHLGIEVKNSHRALADVETTVVLLRYLAYLVMRK